jgi:hypothetical protein
VHSDGVDRLAHPKFEHSSDEKWVKRRYPAQHTTQMGIEIVNALSRQPSHGREPTPVGIQVSIPV